MSPLRRALGRRPLLFVAVLFVNASTSACAGEEVQPRAANQLAGRLYLYVNDVQAPQHGLLVLTLKDGICATLCEDRMYPQRVAPDGRKIAFPVVPQHPGGTGILDLDVEEKPIRISMKPTWPSWSSDGKRLLLSVLDGARAAGEPSNWTVNADGSGIMPLALPETEQVWDWSPDGQWVLTSSSQLTDDATAVLPLDFRPLYVMRLDGRERRMIAVPGKPGDSRTSGSRNTTNSCRPRFSPDGREILSLRTFSIARADHSTPRIETRLWITDRNGRNSRFVFTGSDENGYPLSAVWSPDGRSLAVVVATNDPCNPRLGCEFRLLVMDAVNGQNRREVPAPKPTVVRLIDWR